MNVTFFRTLLLAMVFTIAACSSDPTDKKIGSDQDVPTTTPLDTVPVIAQHTDSTPPVWTGDYEKKYDNGVIMMKGEYRYGKRWGQWMSFFKNGKLWSEGYYENGIRVGKSIVYQENGNKYMEGNYTNGRMTGKWKVYDENGKLVKESDYGK